MYNLVTSRLNVVSLTVVRIELCCGTVSLSFASAFYERVGDKRFLVTNWHCVTGRDPNTGLCKAKDGITPDSLIVWNHSILMVNGQFIRSTGQFFDTPTKIKIPIDYRSGSRWRMHRQGQKIDLAVTEIMQSEGGNLECCISAVQPDKNTELEIGDAVVIVGFPIGLNPTGTLPLWKGGYVASEPAFPAGGEPCFWIDAATRRGMSGSPVFKRLRRPDASREAMSILPGILTIDASDALQFVGIYSGRMGHADLLEAQIGKVWLPRLIAEVVTDGVELDFDEQVEA
ncbi:hypothetical protein ACOSOMT5_P1669 [Acidiphilium sp. MT5]